METPGRHETGRVSPEGIESNRGRIQAAPFATYRKPRRAAQALHASRGATLNNLLKNIGIWLVIGLVVLTVVKQFDARQGPKDAVPYSGFMDRAKAGSVESATVEGRTIKWVSADKKRFVTYTPGDISMVCGR